MYEESFKEQQAKGCSIVHSYTKTINNIKKFSNFLWIIVSNYDCITHYKLHLRAAIA